VTLTYTEAELRALAGEPTRRRGLCVRLVRLCLRLTCGGPRGTASPLSLVMNQRSTALDRLSAEWVNHLISAVL